MKWRRIRTVAAEPRLARVPRTPAAAVSVWLMVVSTLLCPRSFGMSRVLGPPLLVLGVRVQASPFIIHDSAFIVLVRVIVIDLLPALTSPSSELSMQTIRSSCSCPCSCSSAEIPPHGKPVLIMSFVVEGHEREDFSITSATQATAASSGLRTAGAFWRTMNSRRQNSSHGADFGASPEVQQRNGRSRRNPAKDRGATGILVFRQAACYAH